MAQSEMVLQRKNSAWQTALSRSSKCCKHEPYLATQPLCSLFSKSLDPVLAGFEFPASSSILKASCERSRKLYFGFERGAFLHVLHRDDALRMGIGRLQPGQRTQMGRNAHSLEARARRLKSRHEREEGVDRVRAPRMRIGTR